MKKEKKIKIFLSITYLLIIFGFLWVFFNKFSLNEISNYNFIKNNNDFFNKIKDKNFFFISIVFFIATIIWVLLLGFGSPIILIAGFIFGKWIGSVYAALSLSVGATLLYLFANYFLKDLIEKNFSKKFVKLNKKFKKNEFYFFLIYRFVGGIPFVISNVLPCIFNVKVSNFFWATFIGMIPQLFILASISSGFEKVIDQNLIAPKVIDVIINPDIYIPLITFFILILITIFFRKFFYKK